MNSHLSRPASTPVLPSEPLPSVVDGAKLIQTPPDVPAEVIVGLLHKGSKFVFGGPSKAHKTWTLVDLAVSVATGSPWLGFPTKADRVLFVNLEIQPPFFAQRLKAVSEARKVTLQEGCLDILNLRGHPLRYDSLVSSITSQIKSGYSLVILDPIYKLLGGMDENSAGDIGELLAAVDRLATQTRAAIAFAAHFSKGNQAKKEAIDRISGSGVFARDPDAILTLTQHREPHAFSVEATLRNHPPSEAFVVRWEYPLFRRDENLHAGDLRRPNTGGRPPKYQPADLLKCLPAAGAISKDWFDKVQENTGMPRSTFFALRKSLVETCGVIETEGGVWKIPPSNA